MAGLITYRQLQKIYALSKELGLDNDLIHELVYAETGKDSIKALTVPEGILIIDRLQGHGTPKGMATPRQKRFIEGLLKNIGWVLEDGTADITRLEGLLRSKFGVDSYKWLTTKKASEVIEALKALKTRMKVSG